MTNEFVDFDVEAAGLIRVILDEARRGDLHPCSVAAACLEGVVSNLFNVSEKASSKHSQLVAHHNGRDTNLNTQNTHRGG